MSWQTFFPFLRWGRPTTETLRRDAIAGFSVGLVLIPQALAYASLAGMPPVTGLYAALLPSLVGVMWGSLRVLAVGPVALTSLLTFSTLQPLAEPETGQWVTLAIWLAIYSGAIQLMLGVLRWGVLANFVSNAVMAGFINAAALIILITQLPSLLGLPAPQGGQWLAELAAAVADRPGVVLATSAIGLGALVLLRLQVRYRPGWPGMLLIAVAAIVLSAATGFDAAGGDVVGAVPAGLPSLKALPTMSLDTHLALLPAALLIALISFTEAMSSGRVLSRSRGEVWDIDQELIGQGLAKLTSGFSGGFPVSGSLSRSALNHHAGAATGWSALFSAACLVVVLLWLTKLLYYLPQAILAALIIAAIVNLIDIGVFRRLWRVSPPDAIVAMITMGATLLTAPKLHWGVSAGLLSAMFFYLYRLLHPRMVEVGLDARALTLRDRDRHNLPPIAEGVLAIRMDSSLTYISAPLLERFVRQRLVDREVDVVLLCASPTNDIDATGVDVLRHLNWDLQARGIDLQLSGVKLQVRRTLQRAGVLEELGRDSIYPNNRAAIRALAPHTRDRKSAKTRPSAPNSGET